MLRQRRFLHGLERAVDGLPDVIWRRPDGATPRPEDWHDPNFRCLCVELRRAAEGDLTDAQAVFAVFNTGAAVGLTLPPTAPRWTLLLDTTRPDAPPGPVGPEVEAPAHSVLVFAPSV